MEKFLGLGGTSTSAQNPNSSTSQGTPPPPPAGESYNALFPGLFEEASKELFIGHGKDRRDRSALQIVLLVPERRKEGAVHVADFSNVFLLPCTQ